MATILTKRSNTASSVPVAGDLTNSTGGAELAVNTADKRLFTKDSGGTVVELGTNPSSLSLPNGTANAVPYLNGSKVLTSGSALTFDGTNFGVGTSQPVGDSGWTNFTLKGTNGGEFWFQDSTGTGTYTSSQGYIGTSSTDFKMMAFGSGRTLMFGVNNSEQMRLTSTGLGIGTSSPAGKLSVISGSTSTATNVIVGTVDSRAWAIRAEANDGIGYSLRIGPSFANGYGRHLIFATGDSDAERMRLDSSGNLGLGVTPSAWSTNDTALQIRNGAGIAVSATPNLSLFRNSYESATGWRYYANGFAGLFNVESDGAFKFFTAPSGTAGNAISFTQAMTLDASGNLQVGTTTSGGAYATFGNTSAAGANRWASVFGTNSSSAGNPSSFGLTIGWNYSSGGGENNIIYGISAGSTPGLAFSSYNGTTVLERARIDSSGNLLVGKTSASSGYGCQLEPSGTMVTSVSTTGYANHHIIRNPNGDVGAIYSSGSSAVYANFSDYRLKNSVAPMTGALAKVALLKPCTYKWKADGSDGQGFIAHELQEVCPDAVVGEKDAVDADGNPVYQGIDTSFLVATLTAAIQEQQAIINAQQAALDSLKARLDAANL